MVSSFVPAHRRSTTESPAPGGTPRCSRQTPDRCGFRRVEASGLESHRPVADHRHAFDVVRDDDECVTAAAQQGEHSRMPRRPSGSSPASGSSSTTTRGRRASIPASTTRRACPPVSSSIDRPASIRSRPIASNARPCWRIRCPRRPTMRSRRRLCCAATAVAHVGTRVRPALRPVATSVCRRAGTFRVGSIRPAMIHANVDLPDPLPPTISTPSPRRTERSTPCMAVAAQGVRAR